MESLGSVNTVSAITALAVGPGVLAHEMVRGGNSQILFDLVQVQGSFQNPSEKRRKNLPSTYTTLI